MLLQIPDSIFHSNPVSIPKRTTKSYPDTILVVLHCIVLLFYYLCSKMSRSPQGPASKVKFLASLLDSRTTSNSHSNKSSTTPIPKVSSRTSTSAGSVSKYGELQEAGAQRRRWIDNPEEPNCHIGRNTLTLEHLREMPQMWNQLIALQENVELDLQSQLSELGFPPSPEIASIYRRFGIISTSFNWFGSTGPGMISLEDIARNRDCSPPAPYISQISQVLYEKEFPLEDLRHVFVMDIINDNTSDFITGSLYPIANPEPSILSWPVYQPQSWEHGTSEYDALLGTKIGRMIAYLVLGAFERGSRWIQRVVVWSNGLSQPNMRFDIVSAL